MKIVCGIGTAIRFAIICAILGMVLGLVLAASWSRNAADSAVGASEYAPPGLVVAAMPAGGRVPG